MSATSPTTDSGIPPAGTDSTAADAPPVKKAPPFVPSAELRGAFIPWLQEYYRYYDPTKVPLAVWHALERRGEERDLVNELIKKYGPSPVTFQQFRNAYLHRQPLPSRQPKTDAAGVVQPLLPQPNKDRLRMRVFRFYQHYRVMEKLPMVDSIAEAYWRTDENVMMSTLLTKYGPEPVMHCDLVLRPASRRQRGVALVDPTRRGKYVPGPEDAKRDAAKADSDLKAFLRDKEQKEKQQKDNKNSSSDNGSDKQGNTPSPTQKKSPPPPPPSATQPVTATSSHVKVETAPAPAAAPSAAPTEGEPQRQAGTAVCTPLPPSTADSAAVAKEVQEDLDKFLGLDDDDNDSLPSIDAEEAEEESRKLQARMRDLIMNDELL